MREARRRMQDVDFASEKDFRASQPGFIEEGLGDQRQESLKNHPEELAQEFAFEAYEAENEEAALELVDKALLVDPQCVDALTIRAFVTSEDAGELIAALEHVATCGENNLGEAWEMWGIAQWWLYNVLVDMGLVESEDDETEGEPPSAH